ncbi:MAG: hypothetical protein RIA08_06920 [Roseovarius sp.]|uniref:hypothetical protein n=1 Tax=Roseovarius sp. TaxID=1486281 RepID=UPI0032F02394
MPKYILAYHGGNAEGSEISEQEEQSRWQDWKNVMGQACLDEGGRTGWSKTVRAAGVAHNGGTNPLAGYTIVEAEDIETACEMAKGCPILAAGGSVEVAPIGETPARAAPAA